MPLLLFCPPCLGRFPSILRFLANTTTSAPVENTRYPHSRTPFRLQRALATTAAAPNPFSQRYMQIVLNKQFTAKTQEALDLK